MIPDPDLVPTYLRESLDLYAERGIPPGGCLLALLSGDLSAAFARADPITTATMPAIARYIVNRLPHESYGSPEVVAGWIAWHRARGREQIDTASYHDDAALLAADIFAAWADAEGILQLPPELIARARSLGIKTPEEE